MRKEEKLPENIELGITVGVLAAAMIFVCVAWMLWQVPIPAKMVEFPDHLRYWTALQINNFAPPLFQSIADRYRHYLSVVEIGSWPFLWRFNIAVFISIVAGGGIGYLVGKPESAIRHVKGRQVWCGKSGVKRLTALSKKECKSQGDGLRMHATFEWRLSRDRETKHFMIIGSSGCGKTQIMIPLIHAAIARNDRMVIYDIKGDFTTWLPNLVLFAPWDERSYVWDIARDCRNSKDASQLAARLIPSGHDPMWHNAARQVLTAILIKLQSENGTNWGWTDFYNLVCSDQDTLLSIVKKYLPVAVHTVTAPGKTTQSVLINFGAYMEIIADLANAWGELPEKQRFSFREWLSDGKTLHRIVVLQGSERYEELSKAYIQGVMAMVSGFINSPEFKDSQSRRIWFYFDEFPTLGELKPVAAMMPTARSKGIRLVLTAQDMHQIKEIYGDNVAATWMSMVGTLIVGQCKAGETANYVAEKVIGYQTIDRTVVHQGERQAPTRERVLVVEPSELESELGPDGDLVSAILLGFGDAFKLSWPKTKLGKADKLREASVVAPWLLTYSEEQLMHVTQPVLPPLVGADDSLTNPRKPRLILRSKVDVELLAMADTGTPIAEAAEPFDNMTDDSTGGSHESR